MTDEELKERLQRIDENDEIEVSDWEAKFIENVVFEWDGKLTGKQRVAAKAIVKKYWGK